VGVQHGDQDRNRAIAGELAEAALFYADVKGRMEKLGRDRDHLKVLPGAFVVVGDTVSKRARSGRGSTVSYTTTAPSHRSQSRWAMMRRASIPTVPCRKIPESNASKSGRERIVELARRESLTVRQLAQRVGGYGLAFVGTPGMIADQMEEWLFTEASDGFNIMFPYLPGGLNDFVYRVVPELQRRGLFRREYEGAMLRENLGLPRPQNRFFPRAAV